MRPSGKVRIVLEDPVPEGQVVLPAAAREIVRIEHRAARVALEADARRVLAYVSSDGRPSSDFAARDPDRSPTRGGGAPGPWHDSQLIASDWKRVVIGAPFTPGRT